METLSRELDLIPPNGLVIFDPERERRRNTITRRLYVNMGFACNERCSFCYYLEDIVRGTTADADTEEVKRRLRVGRKWGKVRVDLTGGEPTIRKDLEEIVGGIEDACDLVQGVELLDLSPEGDQESGLLDDRSRVQCNGFKQLKIRLAEGTPGRVVEELDNADDALTGLHRSAQHRTRDESARLVHPAGKARVSADVGHEERPYVPVEKR